MILIPLKANILHFKTNNFEQNLLSYVKKYLHFKQKIRNLFGNSDLIFIQNPVISQFMKMNTKIQTNFVAYIFVHFRKNISVYEQNL